MQYTGQIIPLISLSRKVKNIQKYNLKYTFREGAVLGNVRAFIIRRKKTASVTAENAFLFIFPFTFNFSLW